MNVSCILKSIKTSMRDLILTQRGLFIVGREVEKSGPNKGTEREAISRHVQLSEISQISLSTRQDDFVVVHVNGSYDSLFQIPFKTEFVTVLKRLGKERLGGRDIRVVFSDK